MFEVSVTTHFSAAHRLVGYAGACANPHGHNWEVQVFVRGERLNDIGILLDFREIKQALRAVMTDLDHADLNALPAFARENPTSEHLARYLFQALAAKLNGPAGRIHCVRVCETPGTHASYWEDDGHGQGV